MKKKWIAKIPEKDRRKNENDLKLGIRPKATDIRRQNLVNLIFFQTGLHAM